MVSIEKIPQELSKNLKYFFTDIDDTITSDGILPSESYQCIWDLYKNGINVVPITGRPAGWCDMIARMWPVKAVIGENGAFYFSYDQEKKQVRRAYMNENHDNGNLQRKLIEIQDRILLEVPNAGIASDQRFRMFDLAIDICEDVNPLPESDIDAICSILDEEGVQYKRSSIHINCWIENYNKLTCMELFLKDKEMKSLDQMQDCIIFSGDSPNDEPMFEALNHSFAVANIKNYCEILHHKPVYVTSKYSGDGFVEAIKIILKKRNR